MIKFSDVTKAYQTDEPVLAHCSLSVPEGSVYALVGKNGAGKSTLLKLAAGFLCPDYGEICLICQSSMSIFPPGKISDCIRHICRLTAILTEF